MAPMFLIILTASILIGSSSSMSPNEKGGVIYVAGKVMCQDCTSGWNEWVHGAKPIKGAKVSLTCMDDRKRVMYYGSDETDDTGAYEMSLDNYCINGKKLDPKKCSLRLVSSPDPVCNIATDFSGGRSGVKLHRPTVIYRGLVKYMHEPFYYTTSMCDDPDTSGDDSNGKESKY